MDRGTVSRIEGWDARPVTGGYAGLADLAAAEFTGAVVAAGTHLFMLNGRVVGVFDGALSAFEEGESTAYKAPDPALPLLFAMRERGGDVRGKYYTDDTPLREVDETLTDGSFTGFLELSENVLSGDYYVVYYGGRSLSAAFVGNEGRVVTGEEAFELAADEVGIYEVRSVELEVQDVPEPPDDATAGTGTAAAAGAADAADTGGAASDDAAEDESVADVTVDDESAVGDDEIVDDEGEPDPGPDDEPEPVDADVDDAGSEIEPDTASDASAAPEEPDDVPGSEVGDDEAPEGEASNGEAAARDADAGPAGIPEAEPDSDTDETDEVETDEVETDAVERDAVDASGGRPSSETSSGDSRPEGPTDRADPADRLQPSGAERRGEGSEPDERFREEERWREARTVPALDPEETELPPPPGPDAESERQPSTEEAPDRPTEAASTDDAELEPIRGRVRELESELEATERERRRLADRAEALTEERDELAEERAALEERIEELEAVIDDQEARLEAQEAEIAAQASAPSGPEGRSAPAESISEEDALDQTDLFVRYRSKGRATLQAAHDGQADMDEVGENLRLETHSRFDPDDVSVDGRPFEAYLADTIEYRFVAWLVEELLYEIRQTGTERSLRALYDALPRIDRAEFDGTVTGVDEEGDERTETFDVVCRDRMGKPLVVANINDSLDPATGDMMGDLVEDATAAAEPHESIGAAFLVTASFFEPNALETAADATGGGFLSRDSKKSFVKLSRKGGYHLCLVEARGGDFHVAVPEL